MMAITSSGSVSPLVQPARQRVGNVQQWSDPMAEARSKDRVASFRMQNREPYYLGNAFADYEERAGS